MEFEIPASPDHAKTKASSNGTLDAQVLTMKNEKI